MARHKKLPADLYGRCELIGGLRGSTEKTKKNHGGKTAAQIMKIYPELKVSTINAIASIWHRSSPEVMQAIKEGKLSFKKAQVMTAFSKELQNEYLGVAMSTPINSVDLKRRMSKKNSSIAVLADRYIDDGFTDAQTAMMKELKDFLSEKFGVPIKVGVGRTKRIEWRIGYTGLDSAIDIMKKFYLVRENEPENYLVEIVGRGFQSVGGMQMQIGDIVVRFTSKEQVLEHLQRLAEVYERRGGY